MPDWVSTIIAITGVLTSGLLAYLAYSLNRQSQRTSIHRSLGSLYEQLMKYRSDHPEVLKLSNSWDAQCFSVLYTQKKTQDRLWVVYYTYAELVCDFCNTVLYGHKLHLLEKHAYEGHYKPLVKLLITEHYPFIISAFDGPYLSPLIRDFVQKETTRGWNWEQRRKALVGK